MDLSKLTLKPIVKPHQQISVTIKKDLPIIKGITFVDERNKENPFDIETLRINLQKNKMKMIFFIRGSDLIC